VSDAELERKAQRINSVSPSFCLAKWQQVTIDLVNGTNHSCHHPKRHAIPLDEIAVNPSALHNTQYKKEQRKLMLEGKRPPECGYCWTMEDCGSQYSDRIIKSTDPWAYPRLEKISKMPWDANVNPTYVEIMLDDLCNFSCMYCMSDISTGVAQEMKKFGPYNIIHNDHRMGSKKEIDRTPYLTAFWKWLPEIIQDLEVLRITGGEPLLSPEFDKVLKFLETSGHERLTFVVNSHLGHAGRRMDEFTDKIDRLLKLGKIGKFELYTSVDGQGLQAEYMRHGLNYSTLINNIYRVQQRLPGTELVVMATLNILSLGSLQGLLEDLVEIKKFYPMVSLDVSYLRHPEYLRLNIATPDLLERLHHALKWMEDNTPLYFNEHELKKLANIAQWTSRPDIGVEGLQLRKFFYFIEEYDRRKNRSFLEIFPEYKNFWLVCKERIFNSAFVRPEGAAPVVPWSELPRDGV
jgi:organic radical activating enzyme